MTRLSIIIPVLNEESMIQTTLKRLGEEIEIIVVDGGSADRTVELSRECGAIVINSSLQNRAYQMNLGAEMATGEILLFLHADTLLPADYQVRVIETLAYPQTIAGAFELSIDGEEIALRLVEKLVNWRSSFFSLPYGDQAIFLKASLFRDVGGFRDLPIMEDFELVQRLKNKGKIRMVPRKVVTSGRRWRKLGILKTTAINQLVILGYFLKIPPCQLVCFYRRP